MSIDAFANWDDGRNESVAVAPQSVASDWAAVANRLGLHLYDGAFPIYICPSNVEQLIAELVSIRNVLLAEGGPLSGMDDLLAFLDRIKRSKGWEGSLG